MNRAKNGGGTNAGTQAKIRAMKEQQQRWLKDRAATIESGSASATPVPQPAVSDATPVPHTRTGGAQMASAHGGHGIRPEWITGPNQSVSQSIAQTAEEKAAVQSRLQAKSNKLMQEHKRSRERDNLETRIMILEEEIEDMLESSGQCAGSIEQEHAVIGQIDNGILQLDEEVRQFLERIKQRKHALECERATHEEKIRLITHDKGNWENKLAMTNKTLTSLRAQIAAFGV